MSESGTISSIMGNLVVKSAVADLGIQWGLFVIAALFKTEKFFDLAGSGTFLYLAYQTLQWGGTFYPRQKIQSAMVMTWAIRLGLFLFTRVLTSGKDRRFNVAKHNPALFFRFWTVQAVWVFITLLPTLLLNAKKQDKPLSIKDYTGWTLWIIGFLFEVIADYQKSQFRNNPDNAGKFISSGVWSLSRHPNYFGEILLWSGLYISASSVFGGMEYASVLSPAFVALLLTRVSGIPMLERYGMKKWGQDPNYLAYIKNTPVLIPFLN